MKDKLYNIDKYLDVGRYKFPSKEVVLACPGPSLKDVEIDSFDLPVVAVSTSIRLIPEPDVWVFVANTFVKESTQGDAGRKAYMNPKILKVHPAQKNKDRPAKNVMRVAYGKKIGMFKSSILAIHWLHKVGVNKIHFVGCDLHASNHNDKYAYKLDKVDRERIKRKPNLQKHLDDVYEELKELYPLYKKRGCEWVSLNPRSRLKEII